VESSPTPAPLPLDDVRVVECGQGVAAAFAARLLADFGATVIKVEPPQGDVTRRRGPFLHNLPDPGKSGLFLYLNAGKRGVTLDPTDSRDRCALNDLLASADILIHNVAPAHRADCGLDRAALCAAFPSLVVTAISAYGGFGPRANYHAYELNAAHASGMTSLTPRFSPFPDLPPLKFGGHQAEIQGGLHAAIATLGAWWHRLETGRGQAIDVSEQECIAAMLSLSFLPYEGLHVTRLGGGTNVVPWGVFDCIDGQVFIICGDDEQWLRLVELMGDPEWGHDELFKDRESRYQNQDALYALLNEWTKTQRMQELWREAQRRRIPAAPVNTMADVYADEQLKSRNFFVSLPGLVCNGAAVRVPGIPMKSTAMVPRLSNLAPGLGEHHHREILAGLPPKSPGTSLTPKNLEPQRSGPLAGVRVADFSWVWAGPYCGLQLAHLGVEVIRVETAKRPCLNRCIHPYADNRIGLNRAGHYNQWNQSKLSLALDIATAQGAEVARDLVRCCDVVIENFTPGVMDRLGLGYTALSAVRPDLVMISITGYGQMGPYNKNMAYGGLIGAQSGLFTVSSYPGDKTREVGITYADPTAGVWGAFFVMAALLHRKITGQGQHFDLSMYEVMEMMLVEPLLEYAIRGREPASLGNRDPWMAPHNYYKAAGDAERWIAIAVGSEIEWRALCEVIGQPLLADDPRFNTLQARKRNEEELDRIITRWTSARDRWEITAMLQKAGVAAIPAFLDWDLLDDPHLKQRGYFVTLEHPEVGLRPLAGVPYSMSLTPCEVRKAAPCLGADTEHVLGALLGYTTEKIAGLRNDGVTV
jgi:crotonobetainyl-CoA:carnitine CoA-transferase CaiB-like acyl-CoA transferase